MPTRQIQPTMPAVPPPCCMQARTSILCSRSYLCMSHTCGVTGTQMCPKKPYDGFSTVWIIDKVVEPVPVPSAYLPPGCYTMELEKGRENCYPFASEIAGCVAGGWGGGECSERGQVLWDRTCAGRW